VNKAIVDKVSGVLFFLAFVPYILTILGGLTQPSPISWAIWGSVDVLTLVAMKKKNALNSQIIGAVAGASITTLLAVVYGKPTMGSIEWVSIGGAVAGIILWQKTGDALLAIISSQATILIGAIPTFTGAYFNPAQEDPVAWIIWLSSCVCALIAVDKWDLAHALQPITFTIVEGTMVFLVVILPHI
jgi:hypothetical protein